MRSLIDEFCEDTSDRKRELKSSGRNKKRSPKEIVDAFLRSTKYATSDKKREILLKQYGSIDEARQVAEKTGCLKDAKDDYTRFYRAQYYKGNKKKAEEYPGRYTPTHRKKNDGRRKAKFKCSREAKKMTFNNVDLQKAPIEKAEKMLKEIISGERLFTITFDGKSLKNPYVNETRGASFDTTIGIRTDFIEG